PADRIDDDVGAEPAGELLDGLDGVRVPRVDRVGGPELLGPLQLPVVDVDGDDLRCSGQVGPGDRGVADAAAANHGDRVTAADPTGVDRRAEPGHDAAAEQPG